jgi:glycosyltransferase involved in cell wall biosynthesis
MKSKKGFSIIVPCYNSGKYIIEMVNSIISQSFIYPYEIIIVDDFSDDLKTKESLRKINNSGKAKIIRLPKHKGSQVARNVAIRKSKFDFILCMDADDLLNNDKKILLKGSYPDKAIDILLSKTDVAFVYCVWSMFGEFSDLTISAYPVTEELILKKHHMQISVVYRKQEAMSAGLYDEAIAKWQDWSFAVSLLNYRFKRGLKNKIAFIDSPYYLYRIHNNPKRISLSKVNEKDMIRITFKHNPEIFRNYYYGLCDDDIIEKISINKPDKLKDLLYIASYDLNRAIEMSHKRGFIVLGTKEPSNIP